MSIALMIPKLPYNLVLEENNGHIYSMIHKLASNLLCSNKPGKVNIIYYQPPFFKDSIINNLNAGAYVCLVEALKELSERGIDDNEELVEITYTVMRKLLDFRYFKVHTLIDYLNVKWSTCNDVPVYQAALRYALKQILFYPVFIPLDDAKTSSKAKSLQKHIDETTSNVIGHSDAPMAALPVNVPYYTAHTGSNYALETLSQLNNVVTSSNAKLHTCQRIFDQYIKINSNRILPNNREFV